jgi:hypothetical protein
MACWYLSIIGSKKGELSDESNTKGLLYSLRSVVD